MSWLQEAANKNQSNRSGFDIRQNDVDKWVKHYKNRLVSEANLETIIMLAPQERKQRIERLVTKMIEEERVILPRREMDQIIDRIINESVGFGPLESLLKEDEITEIMVNGPKDIFIEQRGNLYKTDTHFQDEEHIRHIIDRIIAPLGRRIDESSPMVDARLPDGSRVNASIPPISLNGPVLSIRKFNKDPFTLGDLIGFGSFTTEMGEFLQALVKAKINTLVSGGTGSGKTTLLNVLSESVPDGERIVTIEDMAELRFEYDNLVRMEARPPNMEGTGEITIRHLVKNALRMRPDRIIVGEVRGSEALDMLQAMNTGHDGSLTTVHANSPKDALGRLEAMVIMSGLPLTVDVIRDYFVGALEIIVQIARLPDGQRKVVSIAEMSEEDGQISIHEIFRFKKEGVTNDGETIGRFETTGYIPKVLEQIKAQGVEISESLFREGELV